MCVVIVGHGLAALSSFLEEGRFWFYVDDEKAKGD